MRKISSVLAGAAIVAGTLSLSAGAVGASEDYDFAKQRDFWKAAAQAADITVYAPSRKDVERVGLEVSEPPTMSSLEMLCVGQWNVIVNFDGNIRNNSDASVTLTQAASSECMDDVGASGAPPSPWSFKAFGKKFTGYYEGCRGTGEGESDPGVAQCPTLDRVYMIVGELPAASGFKKTAVRLETVGMTRAQIRTFIRSMDPVA
jgi:hypothetical protein